MLPSSFLHALRTIFTNRALNIQLSAIAITALAPNMQPTTWADMPATKPNFVIIFSDDHEIDDYGYKNPNRLTPAIDRLKTDGTLFTNYYAASTVCQPSRYALFTGQYPSRGASAVWDYGTRYTEFNTRINEDFPSLAHRLVAEGYQTGMVGKMGGFNVADFPDMKFNDGGPEHKIQVLIRRAKTHGFTYAGSLYKGNRSGGEQHNMEWVTKGALEFLDGTNGAPFFLVVTPTLVHDNPNPSLNRTAPAEYADVAYTHQLSGADLIATQNAHNRDDMPGVDYSRQGVLDRVAAAGAGNAPVTWLDDSIGAIRRKCETLGVMDNTYFMYLTDHGDGNAAKGDLYQNGTNMPLLMVYPGGTPGSICESPISQVDIMATLLDLAGGQFDPAYEYDGISFRTVLEDHSTKHRDYAFSEIGFVRTIAAPPWKYMAFRVPDQAVADAGLPTTFDPHGPVPQDPNVPKSFLTGHFGFFLGPWPQGATAPWETWFSNGWNKHDGYFDRDQLYNIDDDPGEDDNLAYDPAYQAKLAEMKAMMADIVYDLPGSFYEFKFEVEIDGSTVSKRLDIQGDLDLSYAFDTLAVTEASNMTEQSYTIMTYTGSRTGEFSHKKAFQKKGYEVDYSTLGQVKLVRFNFADWKARNNILQNTPDDSDDDSDGIPLMIEYAMDLAPDAISEKDYVLYEIDEITGETPAMQLIYKKLRPELTYTVQWSTTMALGSWSGAGVTEVDLRRDLVKATVPTSGMQKVFMRLHIEEQN